jgi:hypothetical protein
MDSATSASPGLTVASAADGLGSAAEGPRVASTLALVMLLIGESLPDHLREKYAPAPEPDDGPDERGAKSRPNRAIPLVKCRLPSRAFGEQNGLLRHIDRHCRHYDMSGGMHTGSTNVEIGRLRVRTV